jgi:hypothetical protein
MTAGGMANAFVTPPRDGAQQPFGGEERHLRVVGDGAAPAVSGVVIPDPFRPVLAADRFNAVELDRRAQRVADRAPRAGNRRSVRSSRGLLH